MFWGWATLQGVGHICKIGERIDGELCTSILQDEFPATLGQAGQITPWPRMMTPNTPQGRPQNGPNRTRSISRSGLHSHLSMPYWVSVATPQARVQCLWGPSWWCTPALEVSEGGIRESIRGVHRNLIKSMPRRMEPKIKTKECQTKCKQKNWFIVCDRQCILHSTYTLQL